VTRQKRGASGAFTDQPDQSTQRIDKFLWHARLSRDRDSAQAMAQSGMARINGRRVDRAHAAVRIGDVLTLPLTRAVVVVRVLSLPRRRVPAADTGACYQPVDGPDNAGQSVQQRAIDIDAGTGSE